MIDAGPDHLLFIEPADPVLRDPIVDDLTRGMAALLNAAVPHGVSYRGTHRCTCGARSSNRNFALPDGSVTNTLAVHYLAYHRAEVPRSELAKLAVLLRTYGIVPAEPTAGQLAGPQVGGRP